MWGSETLAIGGAVKGVVGAVFRKAIFGSPPVLGRRITGRAFP